MEKENDGMLEKMKRGIRLFSPFASEKEKQPVAAMNTPARLGRMESGYETLVRIFQSKLFLRNEEDRSRCYHFSLEITDSIIKNLNYIGKRKENFCGESCIPVLLTLRKIIKLLQTSSDASLEMKKNERNTDSAGGPLVIAKLRLVDDAIGDMEIGLIHHIAELLDFLAPAMKRCFEQMRKQLPKNDLERFNKNFKAFSEYYSKACGIGDEPENR